MQTRQQITAQAAAQKVQEMKSHPKEADYQGVCKKSPALLQACGLCQALAFAEAKSAKYDEYKCWLDHVSYSMGYACKEVFLSECRKAEVHEYLRLSRETLSAAGWLKRYAEALLKGKD